MGRKVLACLVLIAGQLTKAGGMLVVVDEAGAM